jgi:hypothetical protein
MGFNVTSFLGAEVAPGHHGAMLCSDVKGRGHT